MKNKHENNPHQIPDHAPGAGSDKCHPETPADANERFRKQNSDNTHHESGKKDRG